MALDLSDEFVAGARKLTVTGYSSDGAILFPSRDYGKEANIMTVRNEVYQFCIKKLTNVFWFDIQGSIFLFVLAAHSIRWLCITVLVS